MTGTLEFTGEFMLPGKTGERIEMEHLERYKFAAHYVKGKRVLDAACGAGYASKILCNEGASSYKGVDINPALVEHATEVYGGEGVSFEQGDVTKLPFKEEFDVVISFETIEHVADYAGAIACLRNALVPGGTLLMSSPNRPVTTPAAKLLTDRPNNKFHTQEFNVDELVSILRENGFDVADGAVWGQRQHVLLFWRIVRRIARLFGKKLRGPEDTTSPVVMPIRWKTPRYFLVVATKGA